jgi:adenine-specific DNA-methyltransferase
MSTNVSKQKRKELTDTIKAIHKYIASAKQDENTRNMLTWLSDIEKEINAKKFGLVFEEHREAIDETLETHTPVLTENKKLFIANGTQINFLIEGDNLASLKLLQKTHKGTIDLIYIDPPYNTGNKSWKYNNDYVNKDDAFRHSKWLSFMQKRILIARDLLKETGIFVCAIDDYEYSYLKNILDDIFSEQNRLGSIVVVHNPGGRQDEKFFPTAHEYMLIYGKNILKCNINALSLSEEKIAQYTSQDRYGKYKLRGYRRSGANSRRQDRPNLYYPIYYNAQTGELTIEKKVRFIELLPIDADKTEKCWRWNSKTFMEKKDKYIEVKERNGNFDLYVKERENDNIGERAKTIWYKPKYASVGGTSVLKSLFGTTDKIFDYPKSLDLMLDIIKVASNKNSTILDFFAGSGTTGHAVMELNQNGGNRSFILCTNNENNTCRDVTYIRLKNAIKKEDYSASLKYYKIDYIPISDKLYYEYADELLKHIRELVELENGINFLGNEKIAIVLTDEELDDFVKNIKKHKNCQKLYRAHNVLVSGEQAQRIKSAKIKVNVIPDYYYGDLET